VRKINARLALAVQRASFKSAAKGLDH